MAYYALLDENNVVIQVISGRDETDVVDGIDNWETYYQAQFASCKRTSFNMRGGIHSEGKTPFRKNAAGIGYTYDATRDAFIPPKPFPSWLLNETTCLWDAPQPCPADGEYRWDETNQEWVPVE